MNPRMFALRAELEKRGAVRPDGTVGMIPPSSREERLKAIQDELARRGVLQAEQAAEDSSPSLWTEIPEAVGKGALSGALKTGMGLAAADPMGQEMKMWMQTQDDLAPYAQQHDQILTAGNQELAHRDEETLKNLNSPLSRMAYHGGDWMGSGVVTPGGNVLKGAKAVSTMPALVKEVAKRLGLSLGKDATMGATSGMLQEGDVNPLVADILAPVAVAAGKKVWNGGKWVFSPEYRKEVARPGAEKEIGGILRETMEVPAETKTPFLLTPSGIREAWQDVTHDFKTRKEPLNNRTSPVNEMAYAGASHDINVPEHLNPLESHQVLPDQAGSDVRQFLMNKVNTLKKKRSVETKPLYQELAQVDEGLDPVQGHTLINQKLRTAKGSTRTHLERTQKELEVNDPSPLKKQPLTEDEKKNLTAARQFLRDFEANPHSTPETVAEMKRQLGLEAEPVRRNPKPQEIDNTLQWLGDEIGKASKAGEHSLARELRQVKEALEKDLETIPQGRGYRQKYAELSKPVNAIEDHRTLGKMVEKDPVTKQYKLSDSEIPAKVVGTSLKSVDDAKDLMKHLKGKQGEPARKSLEGTINKSVLDAITDEHGKVSTAKIHTWKKNHPGAFVLYPPLETKLKNLANAQYFTDTLLGKSRNLSVLEAYQSLPLHLFKKLFRKIPAGGKVVDVVHKALGKEKDVLRQELLDKALKDPETARILMTPVREEGKLEKYLQGGIRTGVRVGMGKQEKTGKQE
jgi:hypothetical protein